MVKVLSPVHFGNPYISSFNSQKSFYNRCKQARARPNKNVIAIAIIEVWHPRAKSLCASYARNVEERDSEMPAHAVSRFQVTTDYKSRE